MAPICPAWARRGSSSPSYLLMASLDTARDYMEREGTRRYRQTVQWTGELRERFPALRPGNVELDPARFVLCCTDGFALAEALRRIGIFPEMADRGHVVFLLTCAEDAERISRLKAALEQLGAVREPARSPCPPPPGLPRPVLTPRQALFAPRETIPLGQGEGRISAGQIAPYPPGIPVLAPGERLEKKHLVYLREIGYNIDGTGMEAVCI